MSSLQLFVLDFGCIKARLANVMVYPHWPGQINTYIYRCNYCSICNNEWYKFYLPVDFEQVKEYLATEVSPKGEVLYDNVIEDI